MKQCCHRANQRIGVAARGLATIAGVKLVAPACSAARRVFVQNAKGMEKAVKDRLESVEFGLVQTYRNIAIMPLIAGADGRFQYRTLGEALADWDIAITEVSVAGSVPELMVVNRGNKPVLVIDGEELAGAKQNRVLNTSILIKEVSETKIPVSGTEQGRWSYNSKAFSESGNVMAYKSRSKKNLAVQRSLEEGREPLSDQGEVWSEIACLQAKGCASSPTSAMSDVYKAREEDFRQCADIFKPVANQVGLLAIIDGCPAGLDMVSVASAYAKLHRKLVCSYALEGLLDAPPSPDPGAGQGQVVRSAALHSLGQSGSNHFELARAFLAEITAAEERQFASVGHGTDYRYRSRSGPSTLNHQLSTICGSALVHENEVIHAAFFRLADTDRPEGMASPRWRCHKRK